MSPELKDLIQQVCVCVCVCVWLCVGCCAYPCMHPRVSVRACTSECACVHADRAPPPMQTFRLQYIKDVILGQVVDDLLQQMLTSVVLFSTSDIIDAIMVCVCMCVCV